MPLPMSCTSPSGAPSTTLPSFSSSRGAEAPRAVQEVHNVLEDVVRDDQAAQEILPVLVAFADDLEPLAAELDDLQGLDAGGEHALDDTREPPPRRGPPWPSRAFHPYPSCITSKKTARRIEAEPVAPVYQPSPDDPLSLAAKMSCSMQKAGAPFLLFRSWASRVERLVAESLRSALHRRHLGVAGEEVLHRAVAQLGLEQGLGAVEQDVLAVEYQRLAASLEDPLQVDELLLLS